MVGGFWIGNVIFVIIVLIGMLNVVVLVNLFLFMIVLL